MTLLPAVRGFKNMSSILRYIVLQKKRPNYPILPYLEIITFLLYSDTTTDYEFALKNGVSSSQGHDSRCSSYRA